MQNSSTGLARPETPPSTASHGVAILPSSQPPAKNNRRRDSGYDPDLSSAVADMQTSYATLSFDNIPVTKPQTRIPKQREERRHRKKWVSPESLAKLSKLPPPTPCPSPSCRQRRSLSSSSSMDLENVPPRWSQLHTKHEKNADGKRAPRSVSTGAITGTRRTGYDADDEESDSMQTENGYDGDVEMGDVLPSGKTQGNDIRGDEIGRNGDVKMENVPPSYASSGARFGSNGFGSDHPVLKQLEEEGNGTRKRWRSSDDVDMEEEGRKCEPRQKWRKIGPRRRSEWRENDR